MVSLFVFCFVFIINYKIMSERVERTKDGGVVLVDLCQVDAVSTVAPLLPVILSDVASGMGGVGSTFNVDSLTLSGLRVSDDATDVPDVGVVSVSVGVSSIIKVSDSMGVGVCVSNVSGYGVSSSSLSVSSVLGESGCLVLLGEIDAGPAPRVCDIDGIRNQVCAPCPFEYGVDGDHRPFVLGLNGISDRGAGGVFSSKVEGALVGGIPVVRFAEDICLSNLTGDLVCWSILFVLFG